MVRKLPELPGAPLKKEYFVAITHHIFIGISTQAYSSTKCIFVKSTAKDPPLQQRTIQRNLEQQTAIEERKLVKQTHDLVKFDLDSISFLLNAAPFGERWDVIKTSELYFREQLTSLKITQIQR